MEGKSIESIEHKNERIHSQSAEDSPERNLQPEFNAELQSDRQAQISEIGIKAENEAKKLAEAEKQKKLLQERIKKNYHDLVGISSHIGEYLDLFYKNFPEYKGEAAIGSAGLLAFRHQSEYNYPRANYPEIEKLFTGLPALLSELAQDPKVEFLSDNHLKHVLGNSPKYLMYWADKRALALSEKGGDLSDPNNDTLQRIKTYKKVMDNVIAYLALIEEKPEILMQEMTKESGWQEDLEKYYTGKFSSQEAGWSDVVLRHYNFFARVQGWKPNLKNIRVDSFFTAPIDTTADFERAFESLAQHEILDKEKIYNELFLPRLQVQKKAA